MLTNRACVIFINGSHFIDAAGAKGSVVAFGNAEEFAFIIAKYALLSHSVYLMLIIKKELYFNIANTITI
jgi:hypothetical protein